MAAPIRVLIADDHEIVRKGTGAPLANKRDIQTVGGQVPGARVLVLTGFGVETVHTDVGRVLRKLQLAGRTQTALFARYRGITSLQDGAQTRSV